MKKALSFLIAIFCLSLCFAEDFQGFLGIPFGTSKSKVCSEMKNKGWDYVLSSSTNTELVFSGKKYAGKNTERIIIFLSENKIYSVAVDFRNYSDANEILTALIDKYDLEKNDSTNFYVNKNNSVLFTVIDNTLSISDIKVINKKVTDSSKSKKSNIIDSDL